MFVLPLYDVLILPGVNIYVKISEFEEFALRPPELDGECVMLTAQERKPRYAYQPEDFFEIGVHGVNIVIDAQPLRGQRRAEFRHIVDGFRQQPNHGGIQLLSFEVGDIEIDGNGVGAYHLTDEVLVELFALPVFDVDQFECHDYAFLQ